MEEPDRLSKAIDNLLQKTKGEIRSRIEEVKFNLKAEETNTVMHCYCLKADANGNTRLDDLIDYLDVMIVDYAIPKKEIDEAKKYLNETGSTQKILNLRKKALSLFTDLEKTGEGGEILLYILIQEYLKIPQLISKMSLKTSGALHYQGADGIHVKYDEKNDLLNLYWGEAKMYKNFNDAVKECILGIKNFLLEPYSSSSVQERDLQLLTSNITNNVDDEELENILVRYFDKDDDLSNKVVYKGIGFVGFDTDKYPVSGIECTTENIKNAMVDELLNWNSNVRDRIKSHEKLDIKEIHMFLMPFPSVEDFRKAYLNGLK